MSSYILSADADLDLDEIWEYIAADNIDAADRYRAERRPIEIVAVTPRLTRRPCLPDPACSTRMV